MFGKDFASHKSQGLYVKFTSERLIELLYQLDFYIEDTTAMNLEWVFKHKTLEPKLGKNYITLPKNKVYNEKLILNIIDQIKRFGFSDNDITKAALSL